MKKASSLFALFIFLTGFGFTSCKKNSADDKKYGDAPRTSPMPAALQGQWNMTTSGSSYVYDGWQYGNSGTA